jgi:hypothetical protein
VAARHHRAEALYDLGLAEWRLGHGDAAKERSTPPTPRCAGAGRRHARRDSLPELAARSSSSAWATSRGETPSTGPATSPSVPYVGAVGLDRRVPRTSARPGALRRGLARKPSSSSSIRGCPMRGCLAQAAVAEASPQPSAPSSSAAVNWPSAPPGARRPSTKSSDYAVRYALVQLAAAHLRQALEAATPAGRHHEDRRAGRRASRSAATESTASG